MSHSHTPTPLSLTLLLHRLNTHLAPHSIPRITHISSITPALIIILFEGILEIKIPYVKRENVQIADYMHNLVCLRTYLTEMGLKWLQQKLQPLDLWDLIDMQEDEASIAALECVLDVYEALKDWMERVAREGGVERSRVRFWKGEESHAATYRSRVLDSPESPLGVTTDDVDLQLFTSRFERATAQKRWKEAASLIRELESKTHQVRDKTRRLLELDVEMERKELLDSLRKEKRDLLDSDEESSKATRRRAYSTSSSRVRATSPDVETSPQLHHSSFAPRYRPSPTAAHLYDSKLNASVSYRENAAARNTTSSRRRTSTTSILGLPDTADDVSSVHSFDDLKPSVMRTILNESSIRHPATGDTFRSTRAGNSSLNASRLPEERVVSRFKELQQMDKSFSNEEELESKMQTMLKTHRELKRERQLLEEERKLYRTLNGGESKSTKSKTRPKSAISSRRNINKSLNIMKSRRRSLRSPSTLGTSSTKKHSFSEFKKLYDKCLDAFLNGETDVQPTLAVRNLLRDRKIEEIRLRREKEGVEQRLHQVEARHQREQERVIRSLMKKMQQVEKEKRKFEKIQRKALDSELAHKRSERQAVLESYYKKQIGLLQELMQHTESDDLLKHKTRKWAKELFDRSSDLSRSTLGFLEKSSRLRM